MASARRWSRRLPPGARGGRRLVRRGVAERRGGHGEPEDIAPQRPRSGRPCGRSTVRRRRPLSRPTRAGDHGAISARTAGQFLGLGPRSVVGEEQLLEGGFAAQQLVDARRGQDLQQRLDACPGPGSARPCPRPRPSSRRQRRRGRGPGRRRWLRRSAPTGGASRRAFPSRPATPSRRIPTRSHSASTSLRMCEDRKTVWPRSVASWTQWRNACSISGSRPLVGSSSRSSRGRHIRAAMRMSFWRLPFE